MLDCNHGEADTRIVVHILHALQQDMMTVRTVDTDVVVILAGASTTYLRLNLRQMYLGCIWHKQELSVLHL